MPPPCGQRLHREGSPQLSRAPPEPGAVLSQHPGRAGAAGQGQQGQGRDSQGRGAASRGGSKEHTGTPSSHPSTAQPLLSPRDTRNKQDTLSHHPESASGVLQGGNRGGAELPGAPGLQILGAAEARGADSWHLTALQAAAALGKLSALCRALSSGSSSVPSLLSAGKHKELSPCDCPRLQLSIHPSR